MREGCEGGGWGLGGFVCSWDKFNGLTSGQLVIKLFPDCLKGMFLHFVLRARAVTVSMR